MYIKQNHVKKKSKLSSRLPALHLTNKIIFVLDILYLHLRSFSASFRRCR